LIRPILELLGLAVVLFASTNVDDVFVLVTFFANPRFRWASVVTGQYAGIAVLFAISVATSLFSLIIPREFIGLLGLGPIAIGAKQLLELFREGKHADESPAHLPARHGAGKAWSVAIVTVANGADNIAAYAPAFAVRSRSDIFLIGVVFAGMTGLWCYLAHGMVQHPKIGAPIRRFGRYVAPFVLIGLGLLIIRQAGGVRLHALL
jgi:cadmium resistance protein CadD (predicted permease)